MNGEKNSSCHFEAITIISCTNGCSIGGVFTDYKDPSYLHIEKFEELGSAQLLFAAYQSTTSKKIGEILGSIEYNSYLLATKSGSYQHSFCNVPMWQDVKWKYLKLYFLAIAKSHGIL